MSLWSVYQLFRLATGKEGMGYGDFKLLAAIGAFLGWRMLLPTVLVAAAVGAVVGIVILEPARRKGRGIPIAFGPFLSACGLDHADVGPAICSRATWACSDLRT